MRFRRSSHRPLLARCQVTNKSFVRLDNYPANLRRTRVLSSDLTPPEEACNTWRALYLRLGELEAELMEHIHLENHVLFQRALCA